MSVFVIRASPNLARAHAKPAWATRYLARGARPVREGRDRRVEFHIVSH